MYATVRTAEEKKIKNSFNNFSLNLNDISMTMV